MIDPRLVEYIRTSLARKVPIEEIKQSLLQKGWQEPIIVEAINLAGSALAPNNSPKKISVSTSKKQLSPKGIILGGIFISILLIGIAVFFVLTSTPKLSDTQLSQGASINLGETEEVQFNFNEEEHTIQVTSVSGHAVDVLIQSTPISANIVIGETKKFDLDSNNYYDLQIKLRNITNSIADLYITKINEQICTEDWNCTDWGFCLNLSQERDCTDLNDCGTEKNKPTEVQICTDLTCAGQGGYLCTELQMCNGTTINASDGTTCCSQACTSLAFIECDTIDCFITNAGSCHTSNLTYSFNSTIVGWTQIDSRYYEILGREDGKCELYEKVLSASGFYTETKRQSLLEEGETNETIDALIDYNNAILENVTGESGTCMYSTAQLEEMLTSLKTSGITVTISEAPTYNCTGNLYNASYW